MENGSNFIYPSAFHPLDLSPAPPSPPQLQVSALAQLFAELTVWLWHGTPCPTQNHSLPSPGPPVRPSQKQLFPTDRFLRFSSDVLSTTQVSRSVVLLALLFIARLKTRNSISGQTGSEFRLAVCALMVANKCLDDNTYTAKTWAEVSSLELKPLVAGEAEFLSGLEFKVHVTERDFKAWTKVVEQHVTTRKRHIASTTPARKRARPAPSPPTTPLFGLGFVGIEASSGTSVDAVLSAESHRAERRRGTRRIQGRTAVDTTQLHIPIFSFPSKAISPLPPTPTFSSYPFPPVPPLRASHARSSSDSCQLFNPRKRHADTDFTGDDEHDAKRMALASCLPMAKSYSAGATPAYHKPLRLSPSFSLHSSHHPALDYSSNVSSPACRFSTTTTPTTASSPVDPHQTQREFTLADYFSPTFNSGYASRPDVLSYYSLAPVDRRGERRPRQTSVNEPVYF